MNWLFLIILLSSVVILGANRVQFVTATPTLVENGAVEFTKSSYLPGDTATILLKDSNLNSLRPCSAKWVNIIAPVSQNVFWNLVTGEPQPSAYGGLDENCVFDTNTPANTPMRFIQTRLNGIETLVFDFRPHLAEFSINIDIEDSGQRLNVAFNHEIVDSIPASEERVRISSTSDLSGEWLGFTEVDEGNHDTPSPTSALFKGDVFLSGDPNAVTPEDSSILVKLGDSITVEYFDESGTVTLSSHQGIIAEPTPTPTPIPSANIVALLVLAGSFVVVLMWRLNKDVKFVR